jgi:hypothetical protein
MWALSNYLNMNFKLNRSPLASVSAILFWCLLKIKKERTIIRLRILVKLTTGDTVPYCTGITMKREKASCWSIRNRSGSSTSHYLLLLLWGFPVSHSAFSSNTHENSSLTPHLAHSHSHSLLDWQQGLLEIGYQRRWALPNTKRIRAVRN